MLAEQTQTAIIPALDARKVAEWAKLIQQSIVEIRKTVLHEGSDYGKIPGTNKDVLLKPGAEKMSSAFKLYPVPKLLTGVEDWKDGFFFYRYQIDMIHRETGEVWGSGIGSCNSREKKYAWRWVTESELPAGMDKDTLLKEDGMQTLTEFDFAVKEAKTGGQWGKPAEYWQQFKDAIEAGKAKSIQKETKNGKKPAWEITAGVARYRIPNPEICDLVNTIDKMAYKRAYVAAVLIATNASEFFTQDMEDFMSLALPDEDVIEGVVVDVAPPAAPVVVENRKPTPVPSTLTHFSDFPDKRQYVVSLAIENLFLETGDTWDDVLALCDLTNETVRNIPTGKELGELVKQKAMELFRKNHPDAGKPPEPLPGTDKSKNGFAIVNEAVCLNGKAEFVSPAGKLTVSRTRMIEMLEAGDVHEQFNGKAQIDAMNLRNWGANGGALADCSYTFPPLKLVYRVDNGGNGGIVLVVTDVQPVTDWRNKTTDTPKPDADAEKHAARELDEIPF